MLSCAMQLPSKILLDGLTVNLELKKAVPELIVYALSPGCKVVVSNELMQMLTSLQ